MGTRSGTIRLVVCALALCAVACDDAGAPAVDSGLDAGSDATATCGPTLVPHGPACIPKLDECPGNQVPIPGGGCKKIGVEECSVDGVPGIKGPPDWTCQRIGVQECTVDGNPGIKGPPDWICSPVGIPHCARGWKRVKDWCEPILPPARCPAGSIALIGHSTCQPMGDCGTGTWGTLQTSPKTIFVDQAHPGPVFDGSQANPFASIGAALAAAGRDAHVVVAAGTYNEDLEISTPVKLEGRCVEKVFVKGQTAYPEVKGTLRIIHGASGTEVRGLTVTGPSGGIWVLGAKAAIEDVALVRCAATALHVREDADVVARRCKLANNEMGGVSVRGATLELVQSMVRDTSPWPGSLADSGSGVQVVGALASLTVRDCVVSHNHLRGVTAFGGKASLERTVVQDTRPRASDNQYGQGVSNGSYDGHDGTLVLRDCLVRRNRLAGVLLFAGQAELERVTVRDTLPQSSDKEAGHGVLAYEAGGVSGRLTLRHCLVDGNRTVGVDLVGSKALVESSVVRNTLPDVAENVGGHGLQAGEWNGVPARLEVQGCLVQGNTGAGIGVYEGTTATLTRTVVRDTRSGVDGRFGVGIEAATSEPSQVLPELVVEDCLVPANRTVGINLGAAQVAVTRTVVKDTLPQQSDNGGGLGVVAAFGTLAMKDVLVDSSRAAGLAVLSGVATVERAVIARTLAQTDGTAGFGIQVADDPAGDGGGASLQLEDSLLTHNRLVGLGVWSAKAKLARVAILHTQPQLSDNKGGAGVVAAPVPAGGTASVLEMSDCLVAQHRDGLIVERSSATVARSVVRDMLGWATDGTQGVGIAVAGLNSEPADLQLQDSQVLRARSVGVAALSAAARIQRCVIRQTLPEQGSASWGDGLQVAPLLLPTGSFGPRPSLTLEHSLVERSHRAGALLIETKGAVRGSVFRYGVLPVVLDGAVTPEIGEDNVFEHNQDDRITQGPGMAPVPPPVLPPPPKLPETD